MEKKEKLLLIDAKALLYRAHFALMRNPRFNKEGINTSALYGFMGTLISLWQKLSPTHIIVANDAAGPTWRSQVYAPYKANRQSQPEDIAAASDYLPTLLDAFQIPILEKKGYEADDVIGTLAVQASKKGLTTYMVTPDKDFSQLVHDNIFWYKPGSGAKPDELLDREAVLAYWGIRAVTQVKDILGLWGDSSDNIPGVPGIGQKRAQHLIATYGSIEGVLAAKDKLSPKQKELFTQYGDQALLSKKLATITTNLPLAFSPETTKHQGIDQVKVKALFTKLGFQSLEKRLFGDSEPKAEQLTLFGQTPTQVAKSEEKKWASVANTKHTYTCIDTLQACKSLVEKLKKSPYFAFDTETTSLVSRHADILGISIAYQPHHAYYIPLHKDSSLQKDDIIKCLAPLFADTNIKKIGQNLKYDLHVLRGYGLLVKGPFFDTMVAHHLLQPEGRHGLDHMAKTYLHYEPIPIDELIGPKGKNQKSMASVDLDLLTTYACEDADLTLQLYEKFALALKKENLLLLFQNVEMPLLPVLVEMEAAGVTIDVEALEKSSQAIAKQTQALTEEIYTLAKTTFNIDSPKQLGQVLFETLKIVNNPTKTKSGQYSTSEAILSKLTKKHAIIPKVLSYRALQKLRSTYIDALPELIDPLDGRVHTSYQQSIVSTGRLSSTRPNLQNIPIRTARGRTIRQAFVPRSKAGYLLAADYSQIELRIMAHLSGDRNLIQTFEQGQDVHRATAAKLFGVSKEEVTDAQRRKAKMTNFSIIYGVTPFGLAQRLEISRHEAAEIINNYFTTFPDVKTYINEAIEKARQKGWATTLLGRKRFLADINSRNATLRSFAERNAINMPIQGTQAEMIKKAMIAIFTWLKKNNMRSKMIMQVHDELVFDVHHDELATLQKKIPTLMEKALPLSLPIVVDLGVGKNWLEAH